MSAPRWWALLLSGASAACAFAALGVALYAGHPRMAEAGRIFAGVGFATGMLCLWLPLWLDGLPLRRQAAAAGAAGTAEPDGARVARRRLAAISEPLPAAGVVLVDAPPLRPAALTTAADAQPGLGGVPASHRSSPIDRSAPAITARSRAWVPPAVAAEMAQARGFADTRPARGADEATLRRAATVGLATTGLAPGASTVATADATTDVTTDATATDAGRPRVRAHSQALARHDALAG